MLSMPVFNGCYHHNGGASRGKEGGNVWVGYGGHWQWCGGGDGCLDGVVRLRDLAPFFPYFWRETGS